MVAYIRGFYRLVQDTAKDFNEYDRYEDQETGRFVTRNYIPIGTGTVFKMGLTSFTALFLVYVSHVVADCSRPEAMPELTCQVINGTWKCIIVPAGATLVLDAYRITRNLSST